MHFFSTLMVCLGAHFSAVWIVVANSWQQTPAGFHVVARDGSARAEITDFWALVFNPSSMDRLWHVLMGAWQAGAFFVLSVSAWYLLRKRHEAFARASFKIAVAVAMAASLLQLASGHTSAEGVAKNQPAKLAAFEGHYATGPADLTLFGWVDEKSERAVGPALPGILSVLVHGEASAPVTGLREFPPADRPPVQPVFQAYHLMVGIGMGLIALAALGLFHQWRGTLASRRWLLWAFVLSVLGPQAANQLGWFAAEVGRQPWIVQGLLRTSDAWSPVVGAGEVLCSIVLFGAVYLLLFALFLYLLNHKIQHGPAEEDLTTGRHRA
jgi:cytochrome d ubiquinol oxidase subunit I